MPWGQWVPGSMFLRVSVYQDWWVLTLVCTELGIGVPWDQ